MTTTPPAIAVSDHGTTLAIGYEDCIKYHGRTNIGGVALGFRLIERAIADLCPDGVPDRARFSVFTAFPGSGVQDAVEMVTRAPSRGAYRVDAAARIPDAPEAAAGRLYFEVAYGTRRAAYALPEGAMSPEFIALARRVQAGTASAADQARLVALKEDLARAIMGTPLDQLFRSVPVAQPT